MRGRECAGAWLLRHGLRAWSVGLPRGCCLVSCLTRAITAHAHRESHRHRRHAECQREQSRKNFRSFELHHCRVALRRLRSRRYAHPLGEYTCTVNAARAHDVRSGQPRQVRRLRQASGRSRASLVAPHPMSDCSPGGVPTLWPQLRTWSKQFRLGLPTIEVCVRLRTATMIKKNAIMTDRCVSWSKV